MLVLTMYMLSVAVSISKDLMVSALIADVDKSSVENEKFASKGKMQ